MFSVCGRLNPHLRVIDSPILEGAVAGIVCARVLIFAPVTGEVPINAGQAPVAGENVKNRGQKQYG